MADYSRKQIESLNELKTWIKRKLGFPTIQVEIDDSALEDNINDAIQYFYKYAADVNYRNALVLTLSAGQTEYNLSGIDVASIVDFDATYSYGGSVTTLFTAQNVLYNEGLLISNNTVDLVSWEIANQYLEAVKERFTVKFFVDYNKYSKILKITPKPTQTLVGILQVYSRWNFNTKSTIYNEIFIKNYSLALSKIVLGRVYSKYSGLPIPGGGTLNGDALIAEGILEKAELENSIQDTDGEPYAFLVG